MTYTEAKLKGILMGMLRTIAGAVPIRHEDTISSGIPDISFSFNGSTSWWEVKFGNPEFESKGIQELTMLRLYRATKAYYIIYRQTADGRSQQTSIVRPPDLASMKKWDTQNGLQHDWVVERILREHNYGNA